MITERGLTLDVELEEEPTMDSEVFYNPRMRTNRDISVAALALAQKDLGRDLRICDAMTASGVRGLRYLNEVDGIDTATLLDMNPSAIATAERNRELNDIPASKADILKADANSVLTQNYHAFDVIDIDPFGTPLPYLDSMVRAANYESYVMVTATDLSILAGSYEKVCRRHYAAQPLHREFHHEAGLRILIRTIFEQCARYDFAFELKLAYYEGHYYRIIGKVRESKKQCNRWLDRVGHLFYCRACDWRETTTKRDWITACPHCGHDDLEHAGPLWTWQIADAGFVSDVIEECAERGFEDAIPLLEQVHAECEIEMPFYDTHALGSKAGCNAPRRDDLIEALREHGYRATATHFTPTGIRTDAPIDVIHDALN